MTDVVERHTTDREVERKVVTPPRPLVRWIEMLVFLGFAVVAGVAIWFLAGTTEYADDGSFQLAEDMRFERLAEPYHLRQFVMAEDLVGDTSWVDAETIRFERIGDAVALAQLKEFAAAEDMVGIMDPFDYAETMRFRRIGGLEGLIPQSLITAMEQEAAILAGDYFGYMPMNYWLAQDMQELADIYTGDYFGYMPENHWFLLHMQELADIYTGDYFGYMPMDYWSTGA